MLGARFAGGSTYHHRTARREFMGDGLADAARRAGHQGHLALQFCRLFVHVSSVVTYRRKRRAVSVLAEGSPRGFQRRWIGDRKAGEFVDEVLGRANVWTQATNANIECH